jgi:hypothetical protein
MRKGEEAYMEYKLNREAITVNEVVFDASQEQPIDLDLSLPDYCPDIQKIMKCQVYPCITAKSILGDCLEVSGTATMRLLYLDAGGTQIRCYENATQFSATIPLKRSVGNALVYTYTQVEYVNCRATSPRRLDIHGAFSICAKVVEQVENQVLCDIEGENMEQQKKSISISRVAGASQQQFSVTEVLEINDGKPPAENILRTDAFAQVEEVKMLDNKLIVKGALSLKILYQSSLSESMPECMEYSIPYSQMLDCSGISDDCVCDVQLDVMSAGVQMKSDSSGENMLLDAEIRLIAYINAYLDTEVNLVTDAYSTEVEVSLEYQQKNLVKLLESVTDTCSQKNHFEFEEAGISKVVDVWNEMRQVTAQMEEGNLIYRGKFNLCVLAVNGDGKPFYFERVLEFQYGREWSRSMEDLRCDCAVSVANISYRITGTSGIEVKTELKLEATLYQQNMYKMISDLVPNEDQPKSKDSEAALILYYAEAGEELWGIARSYCTSMERIKTENDLVEDVVEQPGMLLIPV